MGNMGILPLRETFAIWKKIQLLLFSVYIRKKLKDGFIKFIKFNISYGLCFGSHTWCSYMLKVCLNLTAYRL